MARRRNDRHLELPDHMVKANLIEHIVRSVHENPDVLIQAKVKLPSRSNPKRKREIDVLVTAQVLGRSMHLAFECKNYGMRLGVPKVDEFRGKLEDVGIPIQHGIMVGSSAGFTADAKDRARNLGIRLLELDGLTADRLELEIYDAYQSLVYLLLSVDEISVTNDVSNANTMELLFLRDKDGKFCGGLLVVCHQ